MVQNRWKGRPYQFVSAWFILLPYLLLPYITMRVRAGEIFPNQQLIIFILIWLLEEDWLDLNPPVVELQIITFNHPGMVSIRNLSPEYGYSSYHLHLHARDIGVLTPPPERGIYRRRRPKVGLPVYSFEEQPITSRGAASLSLPKPSTQHIQPPHLTWMPQAPSKTYLRAPSTILKGPTLPNFVSATFKHHIPISPDEPLVRDHSAACPIW